MNDKTPEPMGKGTARRRLIRGIFAAPAVLPLYSGAQVAVASNRRCIQNEVSAGATPPTATEADTWVRVQLWTLSITNNQGRVDIDSYWVWGSDVVALLNTQPSSSTSYLNTNQWECFSITGNSSSYEPGHISDDPKGLPKYSNYQLTQNGPYAAVRVNADGKIIGVVGVGPDGGGAVHHSCWTSFKAG